jgi:hypothetical protein
MIIKLVLPVIALVSLSTICLAEEDASSFTAPQFLVDAKVVDSHHGPTLVAARLYFDQITQSFHSGPQPTSGLTGNRMRQVSMLQSEWMRFPFNISKFTAIDGKELTFEAVNESLTTPVAILLLPEGAVLHPAIKNTLRPGTIVVSRAGGTSPGELVTRPKAR